MALAAKGTAVFLEGVSVTSCSILYFLKLKIFTFECLLGFLWSLETSLGKEPSDVFLWSSQASKYFEGRYFSMFPSAKGTQF